MKRKTKTIEANKSQKNIKRKIGHKIAAPDSGNVFINKGAEKVNLGYGWAPDFPTTLRKRRFCTLSLDARRF